MNFQVADAGDWSKDETLHSVLDHPRCIMSAFELIDTCTYIGCNKERIEFVGVRCVTDADFHLVCVLHWPRKLKYNNTTSIKPLKNYLGK